jgi:CMP-N-acetylneuraminic acid synthetase
MIKKKKIISVITARKGSTRIKNKNLKIFCGKPLIYWSILVSKKSKYVDKTYVTSDDPKILKFALKMKCEIVKRGKNLSNNTIMNDAAVVDVLKKYGKQFHLCVFLQPTSPLRFVKDIDKSIEKFFSSKCDSLLSVMKNEHFKFFWGKNKSNFFSPINYDIKKRPRSQSAESQYQENGSIYLTKVKLFLKNKNRLVGKKQIYEMPGWQFGETDTKADFTKLQKIFKKYIRYK